MPASAMKPRAIRPRRRPRPDAIGKNRTCRNAPMSEEADRRSIRRAGADTNGLALDLAMEEARADSSHRAKVDAFFDRQIALTALQEHHLHAQFPLQFRQLQLGVSEKRLGVLLRAGHRVCRLCHRRGAGLYGVERRPQQRRCDRAFFGAARPGQPRPDRRSGGGPAAGPLVDMQAQTNSQRAPGTYHQQLGREEHQAGHSRNRRVAGRAGFLPAGKAGRRHPCQRRSGAWRRRASA